MQKIRRILGFLYILGLLCARYIGPSHCHHDITRMSSPGSNRLYKTKQQPKKKKKCESYCAMEFGLAGREREMKRTPV
jgi:hypothetical protein